MEYSQFFFTLFCMVGFCLGFNKIMEEGQLLYFLRKPFEGLAVEIEGKEKIYEDLKPWRKSHELIELQHQITGLKIKYYLSKPLVLCITCFASIWGGSVFVALNGLNENLLPYLIIACVSSAFIQTVIYVKTNF
jgi:hypothetical protein